MMVLTSDNIEMLRKIEVSSNIDKMVEQARLRQQLVMSNGIMEDGILQDLGPIKKMESPNIVTIKKKQQVLSAILQLQKN